MLPNTLEFGVRLKKPKMEALFFQPAWIRRLRLAVEKLMIKVKRMMHSHEWVTIAIGGHTNSGKTTMLRTLTKRPFGDVRDEANTTKIAELAPIDTLYASIIDCPGFQNAAKVVGGAENPVEEEPMDPSTAGSSLTAFDQRALDALKGVDVVLYVASLEGVPDDSHGTELSLINSFCTQIVGLINKYQLAVRGHGKAAADRRVQLWAKFLIDAGVPAVIVFDSHWDRPSKIAEIYAEVQRLLPEGKRLAFAGRLEMFEDRQRQIQMQAFGQIADLILRARKLEIVASSDEHGHASDKAYAFVREKMARELGDLLGEYVRGLAELFVLAADYPNVSAESLSVAARESTTPGDRAKAIGSTSTAGGKWGAIIGGLVGAVIGFFVAGVGAFAGAAAGSGVGATILGVGGTILGTFTATSKKIVGSPAYQDLNGLARIALAICWGVSHQGFGKSPEVQLPRILELLQLVEKETKDIKAPDWLHATASQISRWCESMFSTLANSSEN